MPPADLAGYLAHASDGVEREREVERWALDRAAWDRIVVAPFTALYDDYRRELTAARSTLARWSGAIATRKHFAGDPALTPGQARTRWLLPVLYPSEIATAGGAPIDVVFLRDGDRWRAITGIDRILRARVDQRDPACGVVFDAPRPSKVCRETAWAVADATLRTDGARLAHACAIAKTACVTQSP